MKVEMTVQVSINGRPIWRKAKDMRSELTVQMTDKEYAHVLNAAIAELSDQAKKWRVEAERDKEPVRK